MPSADFKSDTVRWAKKDGALDKGAITYADGHFYCLGENSGTVALLKASPDGYKEDGRFTLKPQAKHRPGGKIWTHPVISNGYLYLRDQQYLHCFHIAPIKGFR